MPFSHVTLKDVSIAAGVSQALVSVVLNGRHCRMKASEATRRKILATASRLGYVANQNARALRMSCSLLIGVLSYDVQASFVPEILSGIETGLLSAGYGVLLGTFADEKELGERLAMFRERNVDGVIMISMHSEACRKVHESVPSQSCVYVGCNPGVEGCGSVRADGAAVGRLAAEAFHARGHRRFCHFGRSPHLSQAWTERLTELGVPQENLLELPCLNYFAEGVETFRAFCQKHPEVTAVFADGDVLGAAAMKAAQGLGRRVPEDLAVLGVDDSSICTMLTPELASIHQPRSGQGKAAAELILSQLRGEAARHVVLPVHLVCRESLGKEV